jgi:hypothetical protein
MFKREAPASEGILTGERAIVHAEIVVVDMNVPDGLRCASISNSAFTADELWRVAQPAQLWVHEVGSALPANMTETLLELGARVATVKNSEAIWAAVAQELQRRVEEQRGMHSEMQRELTTLRRELHRALSALSDRHPILGLMPSATLDDFQANRYPHAALQPENPWALMARPGIVSQPPLTSDLVELRAERDRLQAQIDALSATKLVRWSSRPRAWYAALRRRVNG